MSFGTDNSNLTHSSLFPHVVGTHPQALFRLDNYVGTISQLENRNFERSFDLSGSYPTIQRVSVKMDVMMVFVSNPLIDC